MAGSTDRHMVHGFAASVFNVQPRRSSFLVRIEHSVYGLHIYTEISAGATYAFALSQSNTPLPPLPTEITKHHREVQLWFSLKQNINKKKDKAIHLV